MLTLSQRRAYEFIRAYIDSKGYAPTIAEIAIGIGIKSRGVVHRYVKALEDAGLIAIQAKRHRNITLMRASNEGIPLVGSIAAGQPITAIADNENIDIGNIFSGQGRYALRVKGDSMIEEGIFDGDIVVCEQSDMARDGEIVVALIDNDEATLKRFKRKSEQTVVLYPANASMQPLIYPAERVKIQGIYIGLLRMAR